MGLTVGSLVKSVTGNKRLHTGTLTFDSSYPSDGEALAASAIGLSVIDSISITPTAGYTFAYDYTNAKVLAYGGSGAHTHTENTAGVYTQNATTGAVSTATVGAASAQVPDTTDLSAVVARFSAVGR